MKHRAIEIEFSARFERCAYPSGIQQVNRYDHVFGRKVRGVQARLGRCYVEFLVSWRRARSA